MRKKAYLTLLALLFCAGANGQAYKWTDEDGIVHYSDRPHEGAEVIQLPRDDRPHSAMQRPAPTRAQPPAPEQQDDANGYQSLAVTSPGSEETLWNLEGSLNVTLNLSPGLKSGHRIRVYFDGQPRMVTDTSFEIEEVFRGTHNIQAEVLDQAGQLMIRSETNRFYVQQTSVLNPARARPPRPTPR